MHQRPGWLLSGEPLWHISQIYHSRAPLEACSALNVSTGVWLQTSVLLLSSRQQRAAAPRKILTKRSEANAQQSLVTALEVNCSDHFKLRHRCLALKMKNADYNVLTPSSRQLEYKCSLNVPQTERESFFYFSSNSRQTNPLKCVVNANPFSLSIFLFHITSSITSIWTFAHLWSSLI